MCTDKSKRPISIIMQLLNFRLVPTYSTIFVFFFFRIIPFFFLYNSERLNENNTTDFKCKTILSNIITSAKILNILFDKFLLFFLKYLIYRQKRLFSFSRHNNHNIDRIILYLLWTTVIHSPTHFFVSFSIFLKRLSSLIIVSRLTSYLRRYIPSCLFKAHRAVYFIYDRDVLQYHNNNIIACGARVVDLGFIGGLLVETFYRCVTESRWMRYNFAGASRETCLPNDA